MKLIDLKEFSPGKIHPQYIGVPQPMKIYHSTEEFLSGEGKSGWDLASNALELQSILRRIGISEKHCEYNRLDAYNIWLKTGEKAVPDYFTEDDQVVYKLDDDGKVILTDGVYIKLYVVYTTPSRLICWTSTGLFKVTISEWAFSGANKLQYFKISTTNKIRYTSYNQRLESILNGKRTSVQDVRLFYFAFNPMSETFLDFDKSVARVYGNSIRKADRMKIINSEKFKKIMIREMSKFMPNLQAELQQIITPAKYGKLLLDSLEMTVTDKNVPVQDKLNFFREVKEQVFDATDEGILAPQTIRQNNLDAANAPKQIDGKRELIVIEEPDMTGGPKTIEQLEKETGAIDYTNDIDDEEFLVVR